MFDLLLSRKENRNINPNQNLLRTSFVSNPSQSFVVEMNKIFETISAKDLQENNKRFQAFFKAIQSWKSLQQLYVSKLIQIQSNFKQKVTFSNDSTRQPVQKQIKNTTSRQTMQLIDMQLYTLLETLITNHKDMLTKITQDIHKVNQQYSNVLSKQVKQFMSQQKQITKQLNSSKQQLQKVLIKKNKLKKQKQQELILQIFMQDSIDCTMEQKIRRFNKFKEIEKQKQQYQLKVNESIDSYQNLSQLLKKNRFKYYEKMDQINQCKYELTMKMQLHLLTYFKNLTQGINDMTKQLQCTQEDDLQQKSIRQWSPSKSQIIFQDIQQKKNRKKSQLQESRKQQHFVLGRLSQKKITYVQQSLRLIIQKQIDDLLNYSRDKDVKIKIKKMMETNQINPQETDQMCRQIQLIKKIIKSQNEQRQLINIFKGMVNKNFKLRMNFIFILQFYRINGKFELTIQQFKPIYTLIKQFLEACHDNRDCFVLKHLMILLMTYYVTSDQNEQIIEVPQFLKKSEFKKEEKSTEKQNQKLNPLQMISQNLSVKKKITNINSKQKIYILHFFKYHEAWRDLQFWESLLIECVYSQKKNTLRNLLVGLESASQKKDMIEAQKTAILNQILYVVKNMIIFDFTQKQVKTFAVRFCKLLKQDDKCLKDVNKTIQEAAKQQCQNKQNQSINKYLEKLLK